MTVGSIQQKEVTEKECSKVWPKGRRVPQGETAKYLPFERTSSFWSSQGPPLISKVQNPMGFTNNTHIQLHPREKYTNTHKNPDPSLIWKGYMAPSRQALFIQHVSASLGLLAWVRRGGVIYLILLWGHRHMEGDRSRPHTGHNTSVVLLNQDLLPQPELWHTQTSVSTY